MATKDQERKALEQIAEIIRKVGGADSYIGKAFEGCFEIAQDNIDNDFWNSQKDAIAGIRKNLDSAVTKLYSKTEELIEMKKKLELAKETLKAESERANRLAEYLGEERKKKAEWNSLYNEKAIENVGLNGRIEELELENMKLKAKLYDMMKRF